MTQMTSSGFVITGLIFIASLCTRALTAVVQFFRFGFFAVQGRILALSAISPGLLDGGAQECVGLVQGEEDGTQAGTDVPRSRRVQEVRLLHQVVLPLEE